MSRSTRTILQRAGALTLVAGLTLSAIAGCANSNMAPGLNQGPREFGPVTAQAFKGGKPLTAVVAYKTKGDLAKMATAGFEIWYVDQQQRKAYGQMSADVYPTIKKLGLEPRMVQSPGVFNDFDKGYRTYDQIKAELQAIASKHPKLARFIDIGDSWEKTQGKSDRDIIGLRLGTGDMSKKPAVLFCGNHHAREIVTPEIVLRIAEMLVNGYGQDADLTYFLENRDIYLIPMVNPDGHKLASEGNDWRKNTNTNAGGGSHFGYGPNGPGVDLNRNYGFKWGGPGASSHPSHATFRGPGAFSEPETQAIKSLVESRKFTMLMTYHSFSNLILWPWGNTDAPPPDKRLPAIGKKLGDLSGYKPQQSVDLYPTSGDTTDWAFGEHGIMAYTTEIGSWNDGFDPPYSRMTKFWAENEPGARLMLQLAENPSHVFGPEVAEAAVRGGTLSVDMRGAVEAEVFFGQAGADGTGQPVTVNRGHAELRLPADAAGQLVLVHGRDAKGAWGPIKATFAR